MNPKAQTLQAGKGEVTKSLGMGLPEADLRTAIDNAFQSAGRRLQDYMRRQRGHVKAHPPALQARVTKLLPEEG